MPRAVIHNRTDAEIAVHKGRVGDLSWNGETLIVHDGVTRGGTEIGTGGTGGDGLPDGGTTGQVLVKQSNTDGDAAWEDAASGSSGKWW